MLPEKPWRPEAVLRLGMWLLLSLIAGGAFLQALAPAPDAAPSPHSKFLSMLIGTMAFHGVALLLVHLFVRQNGLSWSAAFGFDRPDRKRDLLLAVKTAIVVLPTAFFLVWISSSIMKGINVEPVAQTSVRAMKEGLPVWHLVVFGAVVVLLAPFVEELLFRGICYPTIKQAGFPAVAWWGTSLLFAVMHANLVTFIPLTFLSFVLIWLYERTGNLMAPILTHVLFNATNFIWLLLDQPAS